MTGMWWLGASHVRNTSSVLTTSSQLPTYPTPSLTLLGPQNGEITKRGAVDRRKHLHCSVWMNQTGRAIGTDLQTSRKVPEFAMAGPQSALKTFRRKWTRRIRLSKVPKEIRHEGQPVKDEEMELLEDQFTFHVYVRGSSVKRHQMRSRHTGRLRLYSVLGAPTFAHLISICMHAMCAWVTTLVHCCLSEVDELSVATRQGCERKFETEEATNGCNSEQRIDPKMQLFAEFLRLQSPTPPAWMAWSQAEGKLMSNTDVQRCVCD
ncbi:uncharacterized protein BP01DRAFT_424230 [Aspergillus saccharolyticus JOP 1030-1]|uniref:Uncharacterized protein n=1 Tax=Aspergillus saccharolyticus JOP 1030-1 TaxID=1450539 RepID=A0A318ZIS0_9EURO|nr:hypothetical protein BP01DRAFT_424230 [Aspergillus saccharolyticus JOP 1030-1]PYH44473.1 hypothetical protein BP01DRAFT_424230 [Aspergillus saccharolyticus JOP 1030-1]